MSACEQENSLSYLRRDEISRLALFAIVLAAHATAWTLALTLRPGLMPPRQIAAETLSTLALTLMSLNLLLSTRARFLERHLWGLDRLFVTHRTNGLSIALIVTSHFLLVPKTVGPVPSKFVGYPMLALLVFAIFLASAPRFPWRNVVPLAYEDWRLTHRFMGVFVILAVTHSLLAHTYVRLVPGLAVYVYSIAMVGLTAWTYRETFGRRRNELPPHQVSSCTVMDDVVEIRLSPPPHSDRVAGQFGFLSLDGAPTHESHPFTLSSPPSEDLRFSIKGSGDFTRSLQSCVRVGSSAVVEGPYGRFDYRRAGQRQLWIAGGIGITPFLSMARDLDPGYDVILVWSVTTESEALYRSELERARQENEAFDYRVHASKRSGHLSIDSLDAAELEGRAVLLCGPVGMRKSLERQLRNAGVRRTDIFFEEFRLR